MGFHRRRLSNDHIRDSYKQRGISFLKSLLSADTIIHEIGLVSDCIDLTNSKLNVYDCWIAIEELVKNDIYNKDMYKLNDQIPNAGIYEILYNSDYSREQKLMEMKLYLSGYREILDAEGIDYTYASSLIINDYYAQIK